MVALAAKYRIQRVTQLTGITTPLVDRMQVDCDCYSELGDGGGGTFVYDASSNLTPNGGTIIGTGPGQWLRPDGDYYDIRWFGAKSGQDSSAAIQATIDAGKGKTVVIPEHGVYIVTGLTMSGSTYDGTTIVSWGGELKLKDNNGAYAYMLDIVNCSRITLDSIRADGNRANQPASEFCHLVNLQGVTDFIAINPKFREMRGDGFCVTWYGSTPSRNVKIINPNLTNTAHDGRNGISLVCAQKVLIANPFICMVGGVINGVRMPGGIDLEVDTSAMVVEDVEIVGGYIYSAGTTGIACIGRAITNDATRDWNIQRVRIDGLNVLRSTSLLSTYFRRARDLDIRMTVSWESTRGDGAGFDWCDGVVADLTFRNCKSGLYVGFEGKVQDIDARVNIRDYSFYGIIATEITRGRFRGRITGAVGGSSIALYCTNNGRSVTQTNVIYSVDCPYDGVQIRGFQNEPGSAVSYVRCSIQECDFSGYPAFSTAIYPSSASPPKHPSLFGFPPALYSVAAAGTDTIDYTAHWEREIVCGGSITIAKAAGTPPDGQPLRLTIKNGTGGAITTTWSADYELAGGAWTDPATTKSRSIEFRYNATASKWREVWRTSGDV